MKKAEGSGLTPAALALAAVVSALAVGVSAQWPSFMRQNTPRSSEGKPDLAAPPPRLPNGKIDFSGTWESRQPPSGRLGGPMVPNLNPATDPPLANFANIGQNFKEGLPFTPWAADLRSRRMATNSRDNPDANCLPLGFMQLHTHSQPRKVVQNVNDVVIMYEANSGLRNIYTDGRSLPENDPQPWWYGYSVGKYEGDTLVVETIGLRDDGWLDVQGAPFTSNAKITEKFRRPTFGRMEIDVTIDDSKAYTKPWTVRINWRLGADEDLIEFICQENNLDVRHLK
ncbi:MAG TPA: hypothetical protein VLV86_15045 [Vicinamibacterales bacterium]|nr:hypothetical protein [Vicinamibacterales bacterium]